MQINISWLYYDLMNTYGDYGNLLTLKYRLQARGIKTKTNYFTINSPTSLLEESDLFLMGGAQDSAQKLVESDLTNKRLAILKTKIKRFTPGLYICGAYQALGEYYLTADNHKIRGLNVIPLYTKTSKKNFKRLIGDIVVEVTHPYLLESSYFAKKNNRYLIGFENHSGQTFLKNNKQKLGHVKHGFGNNNKDQSEGIVYNNSIGTYLHGPILPRNPALADFLIEKAILVKYNQRVSLKPLQDDLEHLNREYLLKQFDV